MIRIGITGGIGSGKSYVCQLLKQRGIPIYHCDDEAKRLMVESSTIRQELNQLIGKDAYRDGQLNKPLIAQYLFADTTHAAQINSIVHPVVKQDFIEWVARQKASTIVQECALLFETEFTDTVDCSILIYAPLDVRLRRVMQRDHATRQQVLARMAQQMDEEEKRKLADFIILNDGTTNLNEQIEELLERILNRNLSK